MTEGILTRCGYRCDLCLAYGPNIDKNPENAVILSDGWYRYFGFRIKPDDIYCDGCITISSNDLKLIDESCPVRPCVINRKLDNCSDCDNYICEKLKGRVVSRDEIEDVLGTEMPDEDYLRFIKPYENKKRLDKLREPGHNGIRG